MALSLQITPTLTKVVIKSIDVLLNETYKKRGLSLFFYLFKISTSSASSASTKIRPQYSHTITFLRIRMSKVR